MPISVTWEVVGLQTAASSGLHAGMWRCGGACGRSMVGHVPTYRFGRGKADRVLTSGYGRGVVDHVPMWSMAGLCFHAVNSVGEVWWVTALPGALASKALSPPYLSHCFFKCL